MIEERRRMVELPKRFTTTLKFNPKMEFSPDLRHLKKLRDENNNVPVNVFGVTRINGEKLLLWFNPLLQPGLERCALAENFGIIPRVIKKLFND